MQNVCSRFKYDNMKNIVATLFRKNCQAVLTELFERPARLIYVREQARQSGICFGRSDFSQCLAQQDRFLKLTRFTTHA